MRFLTVNTSIISIKKEIQADLEKIIFTSSSSLTGADKRNITSSLETLLGDLSASMDLPELIKFLESYWNQLEDEVRWEVFNLFCFLSQINASKTQELFAHLMDLLDQKNFFETPRMAIKGFGMLMNLQKENMEHRIQIFERLFRFVKKHDSMILYKYAFDIPSMIGPVSQELHLEVLDYALQISQLKDLWQDFGKLLLIQVGLFAETGTLPESFGESLTKNLLSLTSSLKGVFFLKNLLLNSHVQKTIDSSEQLKNLVEALDLESEEKLSEVNNTPVNVEKVQIVKLMSLVLGQANWKLDDLASRVLKEESGSSGKKIQGLLMKCMKQRLLTAKINRKTNSVLIM